jgi:hypothetical protein
VEIGKEKQGRSWQNIFASLDFATNYTRGVYHGEARHVREEVVRPRLEEFDGDVGVPDMIDDFQQGRFAEGRTEEEPEASTKAFYDMLSSTQKPVHHITTVSQLDAIGRLLGLKS